MIAASTRLVWLGLAGGMALRRGDLKAAEPWIAELQPMALESGEAQRIIPMACVVLPWLLVTGRSEELRSLAEQVLTTLDGQWPPRSQPSPWSQRSRRRAKPSCCSARSTPCVEPRSRSRRRSSRLALTAGEGLLALLQQRADDAVEQLTAVVDRERELGFVYDAACLELDLARALEAAGQVDAADEARKRAASVLEPLGVVNAF